MSRRNLLAADPAREHGHQKAEHEERKNPVDHEIRMRGTGRYRPCDRMTNDPVASRQFNQPPQHDGQRLHGTAKEHDAVGRGCKAGPEFS
jgi:hypothetical protein